MRGVYFQIGGKLISIGAEDYGEKISRTRILPSKTRFSRLHNDEQCTCTIWSEVREQRTALRSKLN